MTYDSNSPLSLSQMTDNAQYILNYMTGQGWTKNAVCAMLGNMQTESTINPGVWENYDSSNTSGGFGLVQWTPSTKYSDWAKGQGLVVDNIDSQLKRILYELSNKIQWYATKSYPMTFAQFTQSTDTPENLAYAWMYNYERPASLNQPSRQTQARYWYTNLTVGVAPAPAPTPTPTPSPTPDPTPTPTPSPTPSPTPTPDPWTGGSSITIYPNYQYTEGMALTDLNLKTYDKIYPLFIQKYQTLIQDQNANVLDKINQIIDYLNITGNLSNSVVTQWNNVMAWVMNDGLNTDVTNKINTMVSDGTFNTLFNQYLAPSLGDITKLNTTNKSDIVDALNETFGDVQVNTAAIGDLTTLTTSHKDKLVNAINDNAASLAAIAIDVKSPQFGAKGDGVTDDTLAIQNAINYGSAHKMKVYFPYGQYVVSSSLVISNNTHLFGRDDFYDFGTSRGNALTRIINKVNSGALFVSNGGVKITNFSFKGLSSSDESTNTESIVFGFDMDYGKIINNYFYNFAKIVKGNMGAVSHFEMNQCINTKHICIDGTITDSHVKDNYFDMSISVQDYQTMAINGNINLSSIVDNFIDFAYIGINATLATGSKIALNNIDYCITGISISGVDGTTIANNAFTHCSHQYASRLNLSSGNANNTNNWNGIVVNNTAYGLSIIGNHAMMSDVLCYMHNSNYSDIKTSGNVIDKSGSWSNTILFDVNTSDIDKIIIGEHQYKVYSAMPSTTQVFEGQFFYYGTFLFRKLNGWLQLITCNLNRDLSSYSTPISLDLTNMPVRDSLIIQVVAGDGYSGYSYKTYKIFKDSALYVVSMESFESGASVASSTVTVSGNNIQIQFSGTSTSPMIAYRFLNQ